MFRTPIRFRVLPYERAALFRRNVTPEVSGQLEAFVSNGSPEPMEISRVDLIWLASELTDAKVNRGAGGSRNPDVFDLSEHLDHALETRDGSLDGWH